MTPTNTNKEETMTDIIQPVKGTMKKPKTDRQIVGYIANKIWSFNTDTEEDIKDCIQEALNLKAEQYNKLNNQE